jgi:hypothetical protein
VGGKKTAEVNLIAEHAGEAEPLAGWVGKFCFKSVRTNDQRSRVQI